jgi:hypothetical protein
MAGLKLDSEAKRARTEERPQVGIIRLPSLIMRPAHRLAGRVRGCRRAGVSAAGGRRDPQTAGA